MATVSMRIAILQPPAWSWETPSDSLARALAVPRIKFSDLIRAHLRQRTDLGIRSAEIMNTGRPLPDEIINAIVREHLCQAAPTAFLLDRHPLNAAQALALDELLHELDTPLDSVLRLHLPEQEVEGRVRHQSARRLCRNDSAHVYEPAVDTLDVDSACNVCGGELYQREDDKEKRIRSRFNSYEAMVEPIIRHYARQGLLVTVDAVGTPDEIASLALTALRQHQVST
ncbi:MULTISPECIES: adenylate kinase family protein [Streptomyces]|uniref:Adenylate kinase n=1 Tax=Streptomyces mirabilis TaxID=68239 RepID=A0ABU3UAL9_9ACTN|nr:MULTISPECIES: nucleoside monophosphate kinase [Streptomyces]MDU8990948.1 nucleoside monophosphate kinase [Streptomyces mirabilis]NMI54550.1 adenylate kinase [Streptomyces sp. RLA2-12]QDN62890.1 adenylate kinase [Streptomyces sp. S1D4-20]QDN72944.1 adenylate kinase [Streptomyces sp. S1D4-14]QDN83240.1 adenylate kinase [Streptomyces sp. S1A1-7]